MCRCVWARVHMRAHAGRALLADSQQALLDGVPLGFGERAPFAQPVDGLQRGVDQLCVVLGAGEEGGAAGQQGQHSRADVPVQSQRGLGGAQHFLWDPEGQKLSPEADSARDDAPLTS